MHWSSKIAFFLHPVPLGAVVLMAVNDHYLKYNHTSWITGKLSDFCGVFYFPIFLLAIVHLVDHLLRGESASIRKGHLIIAIAVTDLIMIGLKLSPAFSGWITDVFAKNLFPIKIINDPWDLLALSMNLLTYWFVTSRVTSSKVT